MLCLTHYCLSRILLHAFSTLVSFSLHKPSLYCKFSDCFILMHEALHSQQTCLPVHCTGIASCIDHAARMLSNLVSDKRKPNTDSWDERLSVALLTLCTETFDCAYIIMLAKHPLYIGHPKLIVGLCLLKFHNLLL